VGHVKKRGMRPNDKEEEEEEEGEEEERS